MDRYLIKTIHGKQCDIYAVKHHERFHLCKAVPVIEVYEDSTTVPGAKGVKRYRSAIALCVGEELRDELLEGVSSFDMALWLPRAKDGVYEELRLYGVDISDTDMDEWTFRIEDREVIKKFMTEYQDER